METRNVTEIAAKVTLKVFAVLVFLVVFKIAAEYHEYSQYLTKQRAINLSHAVTEIRCGGEMININQAWASEIEKLPGIGEVLAREIIRHRERHGSFRRVEELLAIRGIGEKKFRKLSAMICAE